MSMAIRYGTAVARGAQMGDPGFLGDIGSFIGGAVKTVAKVATGAVTGFAAGGPLGGILGGVSSLFRPKTSPIATSPIGPQINIRGLPGAQPGTGWGTPGFVAGGLGSPITGGTGDQVCFGVGTSRKCYGIGVGGGTAAVGVTPFGPTTLPAPMGGAGTAMIAGCDLKGTHRNKTGYFTRAGYVPPGAKCVKNRRMNPLNPRAVSRAMRRLSSFSRASRCIERDLAKLGRSASRGRSSTKSSCGGRCKK